MTLLRIASLLLLLAAAIAPWVGGAQNAWPGATLWLGFLAAAAFLCVVLARGVEAWREPWCRWLLFPVLFLLGCLAWWATQPEPAFATDFSASHWGFLQLNSPTALFLLPRAERLTFLVCALLGLLAAVELGRVEKFRRHLTWVIGLNGLTIALYALGVRWLGWSGPPWVEFAGAMERYNVVFFHHSVTGACLDLAWPLLVFQEWRSDRKYPLRFKLSLLVVFIVSMAQPLWHSRTGPAIAGVLLVTGVGWRWIAQRGGAQPLRVAAVIGGVFALTFTWQFDQIRRARSERPDGWLSAEASARTAPLRDLTLQAQSETRGDRLVPSDTPTRPAAWLAAVRMAADYPLVGLGPGAWVYRSALYSNDSMVNTFFQFRQFAHQDLLQTAAEWGCLAAAAWLMVWTGAFWRAGAKHRCGIVLALLGLGLHSQVHFPLQTPALQLWAALLLGLAWSSNRPNPTRQIPPPA